MSDLGIQLRVYYEDVVERVDPTVRPAVAVDGRSYPAALVLAVALVFVAVAIGFVPFLVRWVADDPVVDEPTTVTTLPVGPIVSTTIGVLPPPDGTAFGALPGLSVDLTQIVAASWGYVAVGFDPESGRASTWFSTDAALWVPTAITAEIGTVWNISSMTSWNGQILAIGVIREEDSEEPTVMVFTTSNGLDWDSISFDVVEVSEVMAAVDGELVLIGFSQQGHGIPTSTRIHRSTDGVTWSTIEIPPDLIRDGQRFLYAFDASDGAIGLTGMDNRNALITLVLDTDGEWARIEQDLGWDFDLRDIAEGPDGVVATGTQSVDRIDPGISREGAILLWTPDGWEETVTLGTLQLSGITYDGHRYVAVGTDGDRLPGIWESSDGVSDWARIVGGPDTLTETMPDLIGKPWRSIEAVWRLRGSYQVDFVERPATQGDGGTIVSTDPKPGDPLTFEQHVEVVVTHVEIASSGAAPWSNPPLDKGLVPRELVLGWSDPEHQVCPALGLVDQDDDAVPRLGGFGSTVSYDNPDGPGSRGDSSPCTDCGRSAYGVPLGSIFSIDQGFPDWAQWPAYRFDWDDGSFAIIPRPSTTGPYNDIDPETGESTLPQSTAQVWLNNDCSYRVWSWLGLDHLISLVEDLRFVEGLAPP